jgi:hypothetical protein
MIYKFDKNDKSLDFFFFAETLSSLSSPKRNSNRLSCSSPVNPKATVQYVSLDGGGASRSFLHTTFSPRWGFQLQIHWLFVLLLFYNGNRGGGSRVCISYP